MNHLWIMTHPKHKGQERKHSPRLLSVTQQAILTEGSADIIQLNYANLSRTLYAIFVKQLLTKGSLKWRRHKSNVDVCVMNDYDPTTGHLMPPVICSC